MSRSPLTASCQHRIKGAPPKERTRKRALLGAQPPLFDLQKEGKAGSSDHRKKETRASREQQAGRCRPRVISKDKTSAKREEIPLLARNRGKKDTAKKRQRQKAAGGKKQHESKASKRPEKEDLPSSAGGPVGTATGRGRPSQRSPRENISVVKRPGTEKRAKRPVPQRDRKNAARSPLEKNSSFSGKAGTSRRAVRGDGGTGQKRSL